MKSAGFVSLLAGVVALVLTISVMYVLMLPPTSTVTPAATPKERVTLYAGEIGDKFAFGTSPDNLTTPGPTLRLRVGDTVQVKLINAGGIPHTFIVTDKAEEKPLANPLFSGAAIGSPAIPLGPEEEATTVFTPDRPGTFYYMCTIPGHFSRGMYGTLIVSS